ncbi:MFS transporter [Vibrio maritimus]
MSIIITRGYQIVRRLAFNNSKEYGSSLGRDIYLMVIASFLASISVGVTTILVPWMILKDYNPFIFSALATIIGIFIIILLPYLGGGLIKFKSKYLLSCTSYIFCLLLVACYFLNVVGAESTLLVVIIFAFQQVHFTIFHAAKTTLTKKISNKEQYSRVSTILEMEYQIAACGAGAISIFALTRFDSYSVLFISGIILLLSGLIFSFVCESECKSSSISKNSEGGSNISSNLLIMIVVAANIPFVCVMLLNVIRPIFIDDVLGRGADVLASSSLLYTLGAIASGFIITFILKFLLDLKLLLMISISMFSLSTLLCFIGGSVIYLYVCSFFWGAINSISKINSQTITLRETSELNISSIVTKSQKYVMTLRVLSMCLFTLLFYYVDYSYSFLYMFSVSMIGPLLMVIYFYQKKQLR